MLSPNLNIYRIEWLDLVFENRNKNYGAYELRLNYSKTLAKALFLASFLFAGTIIALFSYNLAHNGSPEILPAAISDQVVKMVDVVIPKKELPPPAMEKPAEKQVSAVKTQTKKFLPPKVVAAPLVTEEVPTADELKNSIIGTENADGKPSGINASAGEISSGSGISDNEDGKIFQVVEKAPQFHGGLQEFYKYLSRNLRYPANAIENDISGRVVVSFLVEIDGSLSNIKVIRGIGYGCDEEAVRVLKKSPSWEPGVQNGRNVRVQFTVPLVFNLNN